MTDRPIHLFIQAPGGSLQHAEEYFELESDFGGQIPHAGDLILHPGVRTGSAHDGLRDPERRTFYEVVHRIFSPSVQSWIGLVVTERAGRVEEAPVVSI